MPASFTEQDLAALNAAIATGELTVEYNGRRVTYRSVAELKEARAIVQSDIAANAPSAAASSSGGTMRIAFPVRFTTARGF